MAANDYRSIYARLVDDEDFQALDPEPQRLFFFLRVSEECGPSGLFRFYPETFISRMYKFSTLEGPSKGQRRAFQGALTALISAGYVQVDGNWLLIRNAMRFNPGYRPASDPKHLKNLMTQLEPVKDLSLIKDLFESCEMEIPDGYGKGPRRDIKGAPMPLACTETETESDTETETETETGRKSTIKKKPTKRFSPPTIEEVRSYVLENKYNVDPERFVDFYTAKGWMVGKNKMQDWPAAVRNAREWCKAKGKLNPHMHVGASSDAPPPPSPAETAAKVAALADRLDSAVADCREEFPDVAEAIAFTAEHVRESAANDENILFDLEAELLINCAEALPKDLHSGILNRGRALAKESRAQGDALESSAKALSDRELRELLKLPRLVLIQTD